jgi:hypothetical protein
VAQELCLEKRNSPKPTRIDNRNQHSLPTLRR